MRAPSHRKAILILMATAVLIVLSVPISAIAGDTSLMPEASGSVVTVDSKLAGMSDYKTDGTLATATYEVTLTNTSDAVIGDYQLANTLVNGTYLGGHITVTDASGATVTYQKSEYATTGTFEVSSIAAKGTVTFTYQARVDSSALGASNQLKSAGSTWNLTKTRVTGNAETAASTSSLNVGDDAWYVVEIDNTAGTQPVSIADATLTDTFSNLTYQGAGTMRTLDTTGSTAASGDGTGTVSSEADAISFTPATDVAAGTKVQVWLHFTVDSSATTATPAGMVENTLVASGHSTTTDTPVVTMTIGKTLTNAVYGDDGNAALSYTLTLKNTSDSVATYYQVADALSSGSINSGYTASDGTNDITSQVSLEGSTFTVATIAPAGTVTISYKATVPVTDVAKQTTNQAKPAGSTWSLSRVRVAGPGAETEVEGSLSAGDDVWYLVTVDNTKSTQTVSVADATVTDTFSGLTYVGESTSDGTTSHNGSGPLVFTPTTDVAAGEKAQVWLHFTVNDTATVACTSSTSSHATATAQSVVKVDVAKAISSVAYDTAGTTSVRYSVTLKNQSGTPAENYQLADALPGGTVDKTSLSITGTGNTVAYEDGTFTIGAIPANSTVTLTYAATVASDANVGVTSVNAAKSARSAWNLSEARVTGDSAGTSATDAPLVGDDVWYLVTVDNTQGTENISAADATVTDTFANLTYEGAGTVTAGSVSDNHSASTEDATAITFAPGEVAAGSKAQAWLHFKVARSAIHSGESAYDPKLAGTFTNTAKAEGHAVATNAPVARVIAKKEATKVAYNTDGTATVDYKLTLTNARNGETKGYKFTDVVTNATIDTSSIKGATYAGGTFTVGSIAAMGTGEVTYTATVPTSELNVTNSVAADGSTWGLDAARVDSDGNTAEDTGVLLSSDTVWYLVTVDNAQGTEAVSATDAVVTDTFDNLTYVGAGQVKVVDQNGDDVAGATLGTVTPNGSGSTQTVTFSPGEVAVGTKAQVWLQFSVANSATDSTDANYQPDLAGTVTNIASANGSSAVVTSPVATITADKNVQKVAYGADGTTATVTYKVTLSNTSSVAVGDYLLADKLTNGSYVADSITDIVASDNGSPTVNRIGVASDGTFIVSNIPASGTLTFTYQVAVAQTTQAVSTVDKPAYSAWNLTSTRVTGDGSTTTATDTVHVGDDVWYLVKIDNTKGTQPISVADATVSDTFANLTYVGASTTGGNVVASDDTTVTFTPTTAVAAGDTAQVWLHFTASSTAVDGTSTLQGTVLNKSAAGSHVGLTHEPAKPAETSGDTTVPTDTSTNTPSVTPIPQTGDTTAAGLPALLVTAALLLSLSWLLRKGTQQDR